MKFMQGKCIIITGAGFSAPARLPIQDQIIREMTQKFDGGILNEEDDFETLKFFEAYINVALYLLDIYGKGDYSDIKSAYRMLNENLKESKVITKLIDIFMARKVSVGAEAINIMNDLILDNSIYYREISLLKEKVRECLERESITVNLEDVFTSFDKSLNMKEHIHKYTYAELDKIRHSIVRLFVYYFSKCIDKHDFQHSDYLSFINYLKKNYKNTHPTIITTNWDTLLEKYLDENSMEYGLVLHDNYYIVDGYPRGKGLTEKLNLIKIHGSINWLRCLSCNTLSVTNDAPTILFQDGTKEKCNRCSSENSILFQPEIVTPTMIKSIDSLLYRNLWGASGNELMSAEHIIFVGYSLPLADYDFRYLLQKHVPISTKIDVVLYKNDNPNNIDSPYLKALLPEKRYRDLFPKNPITFYYEGFGEYFASRQ